MESPAEKITREINAELAHEPPGTLTAAAERYVETMMPEGWEWMPLISLSQPPRIAITFT